jgi:hypothetical protein
VGKVAIDDLERGTAMSRVNAGVNNELSSRKVFVPVLLSTINVKA